MQYLVMTSRRDDAPDDVFAAGIGREIAQVKAMYGEGSIRHIWHRSDRPGAVILAEKDTIDDVVEQMSSLPLVQAGAVTVDEVIPLRAYAGFLS